MNIPQVSCECARKESNVRPLPDVRKVLSDGAVLEVEVAVLTNSYADCNRLTFVKKVIRKPVVWRFLEKTRVVFDEFGVELDEVSVCYAKGSAILYSEKVTYERA